MKRSLVILVIVASFLPGCEPRMPQRPKTERVTAAAAEPATARVERLAAAMTIT